jgi:thiol:disulfide interchange protein
MRLACGLAASTVVAASGWAGAEPKVEEREIVWQSDVAHAIETSPGRAHPILIEMTANWCGPCRLMHSTTFRDPVFVDAASRFATVSIDVDRQSEVARKYGVHHHPTLVFLDGEGREIVRLAGYVGAVRLSRVMRAVSKQLEQSKTNEQIRGELDAELGI